MRTSGAASEGLLTYIPILVAVGLLLALFGGSSDMLRTIDSMIHSAAVAVADMVKAAADLL